MIEGGKNETNGQIKHEHYHDYTMTILPGIFKCTLLVHTPKVLSENTPVLIKQLSHL